jgi:hypothetical protein
MLLVVQQVPSRVLDSRAKTTNKCYVFVTVRKHYQYTCFASTSPRSNLSILCFAFLAFSTIPGNLLLARSKPRRLYYIGFGTGRPPAFSVTASRNANQDWAAARKNCALQAGVALFEVRQSVSRLQVDLCFRHCRVAHLTASPLRKRRLVQHVW